MCKHTCVSDFKVNMQICWVHGKIARYLKTMNKKQEKNDQQVFGDENFIQGSDKFAVRSKIRMNFLRVRSPRHPSAIIQFPPRTENCTALHLKFQEFFN